jgi:hypothetical protein
MLSAFHHGRPSLGLESAPDAPWNGTVSHDEEDMCCLYCGAAITLERRYDGDVWVNQRGDRALETCDGFLCNDDCRLLMDVDVSKLLADLTNKRPVSHMDLVKWEARFTDAFEEIKELVRGR